MKSRNQSHQTAIILLGITLIAVAAVGLSFFYSLSRETRVSTVPSPAPSAQYDIIPEQVMDDSVEMPSQLLPGFSVATPPSWTITQKAYGQLDTIGFTHTYYTDGCHESCTGFRLQNGNTYLDLTLSQAWDSSGFRCTNTQEVIELANGWFRTQDEDGYFYVNSGRKNVKLPESSIITEGQQDWISAMPMEDEINGDNYAFCYYGVGTFLEQRPDFLTESNFILSFPRLFGKPSSTQLQEADAIVSSIQGVRNF